MEARENKDRLRKTILAHAPDWNPDVLLCWAQLETGFNPYAAFNFWNIKTFGAWPNYVETPTIEHYGSKDRTEGCKLRRYTSFAEGFKDLLDQLHRNWPNAVAKKDDVAAFLAALKKGRLGAFYTDRDYEKKYMNIWDKHYKTTAVEEKKVTTVTKGEGVIQVNLKDRAKGFVSKKLTALLSLIPVLSDPELMGDMKELYAVCVGVYLGVVGAVDLAKEILTHLKKGDNNA